MQVLKIILIVLEVLLLFNLLIVVHELGHYLAARWRGLKIERFAIWFGKPLWETRINGVSFCLGCIPAGGYVSLPQMAPMETIEGKSDTKVEDLPPIGVLDKIIVAFAGPLFSFLLALAFAAVVWVIGRPVSERETTTVIGYVFKDSPADKVGLRPGDQILEVDGQPVSRFSGVGDNSVTWRVVRSEGDTIPIKFRRGDAIRTVNPIPVKEQTRGWQRKSLRQIGIEPAYTPMIARVVADGPAARAGLKPNDLVEEVNGERIHHPAGVPLAIKKSGLNPMTVKGTRDGRPIEVSLVPEIPEGEKEPRIGIAWDDMGRMALIYPGPVDQVVAALNTMVSTIGALFSSKSDIKPQHLSGPVGILRIYYILFQSDQGWRMAIWFSVLLNVNLALLNMLPIPVLDGGHILLAFIEAVRRKPINVRILNWVQTACAMLVIGYILYVSFYDVQDLRPDKQKPAPEMKFSPKAEPAR